ncbi:hypothetical protein HN011_003395 [Eciton burchellii]|nr:hypothetical protein HN011_003395 [Eciton burchellii]
MEQERKQSPPNAKINGSEDFASNELLPTLCGIESATPARFKVSQDEPESGDEHEETMQTGWTTTGLQKSQKVRNQTAAGLQNVGAIVGHQHRRRRGTLDKIQDM